MLKIIVSTDCPDRSYFRLSDVEPIYTNPGLPSWYDETVTIFNGQGTRRSKYTPGVTSTVVIQTPDFVAVHVGFHHKHHGGQGWFYFVSGAGRQTWRQLSDEHRALVLADWNMNMKAGEAIKPGRKSPSWAVCPGKMKAGIKR